MAVSQAVLGGGIPMFGFSLGRKVDLGYRTNLWVVIASVFVAAAVWFHSGSLLTGAALGGGFFLAWALARELDPLNDLSAFVAAAVFLIFYPWYDSLDLGVIFLLLLLLRLISGICGSKPTYADLAVLAGITVYLVYSRGNNLYLFLLSLALFLAYIRHGKGRFLTIAALVSASLSVSAAIVLPPAEAGLLNRSLPEILAVMLPLSGAGLILLRQRKRDRAVVDDLGNALAGKWIRLSVLYYLAAFMVLLLFERVSMMTWFLLFSAIAGVVLYGLFRPSPGMRL